MVNHAWSATRIEIRKYEDTHAEACRGAWDCLFKGCRERTQTLIKGLDLKTLLWWWYSHYEDPTDLTCDHWTCFFFVVFPWTLDDPTISAVCVCVWHHGHKFTLVGHMTIWCQVIHGLTCVCDASLHMLVWHQMTRRDRRDKHTQRTHTASV